jgi:hypothetical protein
MSPLWKCIPGGDDGADGGWNMNFQGDNSTRLRMSTFVRRDNSMNGSTYHGCHNSGNTLKLNGNTDGNPYFWSGNLPTNGDWYLMVGILHPNGYTGGEWDIGGVYDMSGNKENGATDYKWGTGSTQELRNYLYYCTNTSERQYFAYPRIDVMDGTEPSISALLAGIDAEAEDYVQGLDDASQGGGMSVQKEKTYAGHVSEVGPAPKNLIGWWDFSRHQALDKAGPHDGTLNGNASIVGDQFGGMALQCDGSGDYVDIGNASPELAFGAGDFTCSALVTFNTAGSTRTIIEISEYTHGLLIRPEGSDLSIYLDDSNAGGRWENINFGFSNGETCLVTLTRTNGVLEAYKNDVSQGTNNLGGDITINQQTYIGASVHNTSQSFDGKIHDLRLYDRALTSDEVSILYEMSGPDPKMKMTPEGIYAPEFNETAL